MAGDLVAVLSLLLAEPSTKTGAGAASQTGAAPQTTAALLGAISFAVFAGLRGSRA